jgi:hypothetical protein
VPRATEERIARHRIDIPSKLFTNMKFFHWKKPAIGSAHGKRQVKLIDQAQR